MVSNYKPVPRKPCELCGHLIPASSKYSVCKTTPECRVEYRRQRYTSTEANVYQPVERIPCEVCERPIPAGSKTGVCQKTPACKREYAKRFNQRYPLWSTYQGIITRTTRPEDDSYVNYGGRGIKMYEPWVEDYKAFQAWMDENLGPRPPGKTLDRIDNDGGYEPGNLQWATPLEQAANTRRLPSAINRLRQQLRDAGLEPCC